METDDHEWELSKENVQPLRQGRHMSALVAALHSEHGYGEEQLGIRTQQNQFEMELRTYSGDDPFDVWDRYIKWTEQYYPKGGHEGQLMKLVEQCLKMFQNDDKYRNDERFIQVWLKFAHLVEDPVEVFSYMFDIGIGATVAQMYMEWAIALEKNGDLKRSDAIYTEGLNRCAKPKDMLEQAHLQFQTRVAKNITLQMTENRRSTMVEGEEREKRSALSRLKTHGTLGKVGVARTGNAKLGLAGTLRDTQGAPPKQIPGKKFQIFCDENAPPSLQPQQTEEWQSIPVKAVTNRENERKPGVWTDAKVKQKPGTVSTASAPFEIHEDPCATPQHPKTTMINSQPLSSRKAGSNPDVLSNLRQPTFKPNTGIPMYQKDKIYNGVMEFSFEELRANRYWEKRKAREERRIEEERRQRDERVEQTLRDQQAKIAFLEARLARTELTEQGQSEGQPGTGHMGTVSSTVGQPMPSSSHGPSSNEGPVNNSQLTANSNSNSGAGLHQISSSFVPSSTVAASTTDGGTSHGSSKLAAKQPQVQVRSSTPMEDEDFSMQQQVPPRPEVPRPPLGSLTDTTPSSNSSNININNLSSVSTVTGSGGEARQLSTTSSISKELGGEQQQRQQRQSQASSTTPTSAGPTPESFSLGRGPITAPSPTVHTKEAYQDILGMFNTTFNTDTDSITGPPPSYKTPQHSAEKPAAQPNAGPFQIFEDTTQTGLPAAAPKAEFFIREDTSVGFEMDNGREGFEDAPRFVDENVNILKTLKVTCPRLGLQFAHGEENGSRGSTSTRKDAKGPTRKMGFVVHQENVQDENSRPVPASQTKQSLQIDQGSNIYCGELQDENSYPRPKDLKPGVRRGLALSSATPGAPVATSMSSSSHTIAHHQAMDCMVAGGGEDVEMMPEMTAPCPEFTIEYQAKHDQTLAPLDHFNLQARAASTPFTGGQQQHRAVEQEQAQESSNLLASSASSNWTNMTGSNASNMGNAEVTSNKNLSPIFEGSNEGSNDDMKSLHSTAASSSNVMLRSRHASTHSHSHGADLIQDAVNDGNVSMQDDEDRQQQYQQPQQQQQQVSEPVQAVGPGADLDRSYHHQIDTTMYIPDPEQEQDEKALLSASICIDPRDPFDDATIEHFLATLDPPIQEYTNYMCCRGPLPECENDMPFNDFLTLEECIGEGGYAKVWKASEFLDLTMCTNPMSSGSLAQDKALKIQKSGGQWEFYITCTLEQRLKQLRRPVSATPAILGIEKGYFFDNGSALQMEYITGGSVLNLVNTYRKDQRLKDGVEPFACLLTIELLQLFEQIHACQLIHGDVKPDNFLMLDLPEIPASSDPQQVFGSCLRMVKLIDFGQSIDMTKFPPGTTFTAKVVTDGFQCIEMKTNRPWTYQTDLFGLAGTIHVVLFGSYMNVFQEHGVWRTTGNFIRKWNVPLWKRLFSELLNIPSCWQQPDLASLGAEFENHFITNLRKDYNSWVRRLGLNLS